MSKFDRVAKAQELVAEIERLRADIEYVRDRLTSRDDSDQDIITIRGLIDEATNSGDFFPAYELRRQREEREQHSQTVANVQEVIDMQKKEIERLTTERATLRGALIEIAAYDRGDGCCHDGCDTPSIAAKATIATRPHQAAQAAKESNA